MAENPNPSFHNSRWYHRHPQAKTPKSGGSVEPPGKFSFGDSLGVLALLLGVITFVLTPPLWLKIVMLAITSLLCFAFVRNSHFTYSWSRGWQYVCTAVVISCIFYAGVPQLISQWKQGHPGQSQQAKVLIYPGELKVSAEAGAAYTFTVLNMTDFDLYSVVSRVGVDGGHDAGDFTLVDNPENRRLLYNFGTTTAYDPIFFAWADDKTNAYVGFSVFMYRLKAHERRDFQIRHNVHGVTEVHSCIFAYEEIPQPLIEDSGELKVRLFGSKWLTVWKPVQH